MTNSNDTIAAISTPLGEGGIGIVRISGSKAVDIADRIFTGANGRGNIAFKSHTVNYGSVVEPDTGGVMDEVLLTVMRSPRSYTKEDMVEINCHGGNSTLKRMLEICMNAGARLAEPGEFTKRAFLNGRIDLAQAEAVIDIIRSKTERSRKLAFAQLKGKFSEKIRNIRNTVIDILSLVELNIDFSDEDIDLSAQDDIDDRIRKVYSLVNSLIKTSQKGMLIREGASVVICGRPNVGKSSLMNAILKDDRVIVTPVAGTTRDVIEECIDLNGIKIRLSDTAGIIDTKDRVEIEGIRRSREKLSSSDMVIFVLDAARPLSKRDEEIFEAVKDKKTVIALNKTDLKVKTDLKKARSVFGENIVKVSALKKKGLTELEDAVSRGLLEGDVSSEEGVMITNIRHRDLMAKAAECIGRAASGAYNGELLASDLNEAVRYLGLITGETIGDDVLDRIFEKFCIGK
ncbi:MAG: tRNA uridine-5-carboxymethylaminomethyl(34) synthesis GTPase MnmE [Candidatus Omnitrophota bacterium]|nr:tRNA uridine-5-carboxymethylaminomethyl(34) synthesis GTPase MnmE [Candidatus Omnitrophota bacterium]